MDSTVTTLQRYGAPVTEELDTTQLPVSGDIPSALRGRFVRNGPNPRPGMHPHWFMGDGMVHGVWLGEGRAQRYVNRWVRTPAFSGSAAPYVRNDGSIDLSVGPANTSVVEHAGRMFALVESSFPCELTDDLRTAGPYDFGGRLATPMTAHPKRCFHTGELHFIGYGAPPLPALTYHRADAAGSLVESRPIDIPGRVMMHDFALSRRHVIFMDLPVVFDMERAMQGTMPFRWSDSYGARLGVMERRPGAPVRWFDVEPCYVFHVLNAFDDGDKVSVDAVRYPELWRHSPDDFGAATLHRWTIDLSRGTVVETPLDDVPIEFPRSNEATSGSAQRYGYAVATANARDAHAIVKYDLTSKTSARLDFGPDRMPGEPVFVADGSAAEDSGWLLAFIYDSARDGSDLVIADARTLAVAATVALPQRVPAGFHGAWFPDQTR